MIATRGAQSGQMILEAILIMVMCLGFTFLVARYFKDEEVLKQLITTPWKTMAGMLQNGSWMTPEASNAQHPNGHFRHISIQGESSR